MKKFMKKCVITALILLSGGLTLIIAGIVSGGNEHIRQTVADATNGLLHVNLDPRSPGNFGIYIGRDPSEGTVYSEVTATMVGDSWYFYAFEEGEVTAVGSESRSLLEDQDIRDLKIDVGGCEFWIADSGDDQFYLKTENTDKVRAYTQSGVLHIRRSSEVVYSAKDISEVRIVLYVPRDFVFRSVEIEFGAGNMVLEQLLAKEADIDAGAGKIYIGRLEAGKAKLEAGAGEIQVCEMELGELSAKAGLGSLILNGSISGDSGLECSMGNIVLTLSGREEDFSYKIRCAMGSVNLNGVRYSGLETDKEIRNKGGKNLKAECFMGNIEISTKKND